MGSRRGSARNQGAGMASARKPGSAVLDGVTISHPDKVWWPEEGISKLDVARFYADIALHLLPWMEGRPLTAERCPDGMRGSCFFQKNFGGRVPPGIPTIAVRAESTARNVHYVVGGSRATLLTLVNLGCITIHLMNCRTRSLDEPDWMAFDLDPSSGTFADAARAGRILHGILDELGLRSYPKTSGGRGLHVLIPLRPGPTQDEVRAFAREIGRAMEQRDPKLVTLASAKSARGGRVFVDTLRNAFGQTIAAPYSVRRRPGAPVSTPLDWDEVDSALDPARLNMRTLDRRLAAPNPWADFSRHRQDLRALADRIRSAATRRRRTSRAA